MRANNFKALFVAVALAGMAVQAQSAGGSAPLAAAASSGTSSLVLATLGPKSATLVPPNLHDDRIGARADQGAGLINAAPGQWTSVAIGLFLIAAVMRRRIKSLMG